MTATIHVGDALQVLRTLPDASVHCCVTSPPYWGLRDYGVDGQIGLEASVDDWVRVLVAVLDEVRRVLRPDGTLWLNVGDAYVTTPPGSSGTTSKLTNPVRQTRVSTKHRGDFRGLKRKQRLGLPHRLVFAMQAAGWWWRDEIVWHKPNPMPESVKDRCTKAHEYIFPMSKSARYYYDAHAVKEPATNREPGNKRHKHADRVVAEVAQGNHRGRTKLGLATMAAHESHNRRSVWTVASRPFKGAHFATFPEKLIEPCVQAGCPQGGTVLDPFTGSGTTGVVATRLGRDFVGIELNQEYAAMARHRIAAVAPLFVPRPAAVAGGGE